MGGHENVRHPYPSNTNFEGNKCERVQAGTEGKRSESPGSTQGSSGDKLTVYVFRGIFIPVSRSPKKTPRYLSVLIEFACGWVVFPGQVYHRTASRRRKKPASERPFIFLLYIFSFYTNCLFTPDARFPYNDHYIPTSRSTYHMSAMDDPSRPLSSGMNEYRQVGLCTKYRNVKLLTSTQHLSISENKRQKRRRSWADQDMAYQSLPHGKTYAVLAAEGIVARAKQVRYAQSVFIYWLLTYFRYLQRTMYQGSLQ